MARIYVKRNTKFWTFKRVNKHSMKIWKVIITLMALIVLWAVINKWVNRNPLVDPRCPSSFNPVTKVMAKEPEVVISCNDVVGYIRCKFYSGELTENEAKTLIAIGKAESGLRENAKNKTSTARGVFQILAGTWYSNDCIGNPLNWKDNTNCAIKIMRTSGFYPWDAYNRGMHSKFISDIAI